MWTYLQVSLASKISEICISIIIESNAWLKEIKLEAVHVPWSSYCNWRQYVSFFLAFSCKTALVHSCKYDYWWLENNWLRKTQNLGLPPKCWARLSKHNDQRRFSAVNSLCIVRIIFNSNHELRFLYFKRALLYERFLARYHLGFSSHFRYMYDNCSMKISLNMVPTGIIFHVYDCRVTSKKNISYLHQELVQSPYACLRITTLVKCVSFISDDNVPIGYTLSNYSSPL